MNKYQHDSPEVWDELFKSRDLSYSEKADTQGKLFELVKATFLDDLFKKCHPGPFGSELRAELLDPGSIKKSKGNANALDSRWSVPRAATRGGNDRVKILEVGCGTAFVSLYFAKRGYEVTCLDSSKQILKVAEGNFKKEGVKGRFVVGDAGRLPFEDNSFDIVMSFGLLEHFLDPKPVVQEMVRVLKPGGLFFADVVPKRFSVQSLGNIFNALAVFGYWFIVHQDFKKGWEKAKANFYPDYFENSLSLQEYKKIIEDCRLVHVEIKGNRPWPRITLPYTIDHKLYTPFLKLTIPFWKLFDEYGGSFAKWWGAGWWIWGSKLEQVDNNTVLW